MIPDASHGWFSILLHFYWYFIQGTWYIYHCFFKQAYKNEMTKSFEFCDIYFRQLFLKQFWVLRMGSGVSWHEEWSCSVVWRYGSMAAGWTDCGRGGCCRVVSCGLCVDIWLHLCHWCLINGTRNVPKRFKSPAVEPSFPGQCTNHASLWCFQSGCFLLLLCDSWPEYCLRI